MNSVSTIVVISQAVAKKGLLGGALTPIDVFAEGEVNRGRHGDVERQQTREMRIDNAATMRGRSERGKRRCAPLLSVEGHWLMGNLIR